MVTRANDLQDMGGQVIEQMFADPKALAVTALVLLIMGIIPKYASLRIHLPGSNRGRVRLHH